MKLPLFNNTILDQSKDSFWVINLDFQLIYANKSYLSIIQTIIGREQQLYDSVFHEKVSESDLEKWKAHYMRAIKGAYFEIEDHYYNSDLKATQYGQTTFEPLTNDEDTIFAVACRWKNITNIVQNKNDEKQLMDSSLDVFCTVNEQGHFVYVSAAVLSHWGYLPKELIGTAYIDLILEEDIPKTMEAAEAILAGQDMKSFSNRYKKKDGGIAYNLWSIRWDHTTKLFYCSVRANKEKLEQEVRIQQSEQRFKALVQEGSDLINIVDKEGNYLYANATSAALLGFVPDEKNISNLFQFIHAEDIERVRTDLQKVIIENKVIVKPFRFQNHKKEWRWIEGVLTNLLDNFAVNGIVINTRDITDKIKEKQQLKLFESVVTHTKDAVLITEAEPFDEPGPKILFVNEAFTKMTGYTATEVIGKTPRILQGPKTDREELAKLSKSIRNWQSYEMTTVNYKKNGEEFWINFTVTPVSNEKGWYTHWIAIERDVTVQERINLDLIKAKVKLIASEESFREMFKNMSNGVCRYKAINHGKNFIIADINTAGEQLIKTKKAALLGKSLRDVFPKMKLYGLIDVFKKVWKTGESQHYDEQLYEDNNLSVYFKNFVYKLSSGDIIAIFEDVTENKLAEIEIIKAKEKAEKSEFSMNEAGRMAKIGYWSFDLKSGKMSWSDLLHQMFGSDPKAAAPSFEEVLNNFEEESKQKLIKASLALDNEGISYEQDLQLTNLRNEKIWVRNFGQQMRNDKNEVVGTRGVIQDITQAKKLQLELEISRKNIESSLQLAEKNQRSMTEASTLAKIGYWEYYEVNETFIWSDYMYQIFGLDLKDNIPSQQELMNCLDKKSLKKLNQAISDLTEKGSSYDLELKIHNFKNEELWIRRLVQPIYNHHNEIIGRRGMMQNITDSKNTLLELKTAKEAAEKTLVLAEKSEYSMNEAGKMAKIGYWEYDKEKVALSWSDAVHNIYGSDPKNGVPTLIQILSVYTEESRKKLVEATSNLTNNGVSYHIDLELINFKKEKIWIRDLAQPVYNHKNKIIGRRGMTQDITDIKNTQLEILKAKEKIESNELKFKSYTENSPITIYTTNLEGEWIYVNQNWTEMTGMSPEESLGKRWMNALHPNDVELVRDKWFGSLASRGKWKYEYRFISKTGEILWVEGTARELFNDKNELIGHLGVNVNITERKKAEENLVVTSERLRLATNSAKMGIWDWDILDDQLTWDNKMFELYGVEKDGNSADLKLWQKSVHPDDFEKASKDLEKALSGEQDFNSKFRIIRSDKSIHFIEGTAVVLRDNDGNAIRMIGINVDVTERKKAEQEKNNLQKTLENSLNEIYIFDSETLQFSYANKGALLNLGYSETEIKLITPIDLKPEFTETHFKELIAPLINGAKNKIIFFTNHKRKDGSLYPAEVHLQFFTQGNDKGFLSVVLDITERKKAEEMYRLLSNHTNDLICMHDIDSTFTYISKSIKNLLGFEQNELLQKKVFEIVHQEDIEPLKKILAERIFKGVSTDAFAFRARHKNGHYLWLEAVSSPVIKNNKIVSFVTSTRNINQWMLAKQDVEEYQSSLQKLTTEVALIVEKQKKEIATNIHDQLSESLVISKMRISALEKRTELKSAFEDFDFIKSQISKALENSRKITYELSPPILYQLGLIEALDWFAEDTQEKHGIEFQFSSNIPMLPIDEFKSILIYRCIQEVVNNAIKYAAASLLTLECIKEEKAIVIFVKDNGKGFDTSILKKASKSDTGFGLFAVQERIRSMEGDFTVKSEINKGTTIKIYLPL